MAANMVADQHALRQAFSEKRQKGLYPVAVLSIIATKLLDQIGFFEPRSHHDASECGTCENRIAEARRIAKIFLFGYRSDGQLPFADMPRPKQQDDAAIAKSQTWIADHYAAANPLARMAEQSGLTSCIFKRRIANATGYAPLDYVQTLRIEEARQMLETTDDAIDDIASLVGYDEPNSFRRLFKRATGIMPHTYRVRFKTVVSV